MPKTIRWVWSSRRTLAITVTVATFVFTSAMAPAGDAPEAKPKREPIYDESADAKAQISQALARAAADNKRVLVMFGANWCGWCYKLHDVFKEDKAVAKTLQYEYERVMVDIGRRDKHMDVARAYGADIEKQGVPFLTVLDSAGKVLANQETGSLEAGDRHDPEKVQSFLKHWSAEPVDARRVVDAAFTRAKSERKMLFLHLGAPWCGWCRKLDAFLARKDIAEAFAPDYIDVKVDLERMANATEIASRFRTKEDSGLPWFAIVDASGTVVASSEGPKGNVGFPAAPDEIAHFRSMLQKTARNVTADQIALIERALQDAAKPDK